MVTNISRKSFKIDTTDFSRPEKEKLNEEEAELYSIIFDEEIGAPIEVKKSLKECLSEFLELGILEDEKYPNVIRLAHEAIEEGYDSVEKNNLHVINGNGDAEVICRYKTADSWQMIAAIEKSLIREFYKEKNYPREILSGSMGTQTVNISASSGGSGGGNLQDSHTIYEGNIDGYSVTYKKP